MKTDQSQVQSAFRSVSSEFGVLLIGLLSVTRWNLWCTNVTSTLLSNLIKDKRRPECFFTFHRSDLSAAVARVVNSATFLKMRPHSRSSSTPVAMATKWEISLFFFKFSLYHVCPVLFLANKLLFRFVLAASWFLCERVCVDKCYLNNLSGSVAL